MAKKSKAVNGELSIAGLAKAVSRSDTAVAQWLKSDRWIFGPGPWPASIVPAVQAWAKKTLRAVVSTVQASEVIRPSDDEATKRVKLKILINRVAEQDLRFKRDTLEYDKLRGLVIDRAEVEKHETAQCVVIVHELRSLRGLALKMEGMNLQQREQCLEDFEKHLRNEALEQATFAHPAIAAFFDWLGTTQMEIRNGTAEQAGNRGGDN